MDRRARLEASVSLRGKLGFEHTRKTLAFPFVCNANFTGPPGPGQASRGLSTKVTFHRLENLTIILKKRAPRGNFVSALNLT